MAVGRILDFSQVKARPALPSWPSRVCEQALSKPAKPMWPRSIAVLNFTGMRDNWGCQATSWNLLKFLQRTFRGSHGPRIEVVPYPPRHVLDVVFETGWGRSIEAILASPHPSAQQLDLLEWLVRRRFRQLVERVEAADLVVFQGEGTIGKQEFLRGVRLLALPVLAKRRWRKPVIAMNQSVFAPDRQARAVIKAVLSSFDLLAVREPASLALCHELGLAQTMLCPDMAFMAGPCRPDPQPVRAAAAEYFCVTGSAALHHYPIRDYVRLVKLIAGLHGLRPVLVYSKHCDLRLIEIAEAMWGRGALPAVAGKTHADYGSIMPVLAGARFVLGGRYHTSVLAAVVGTPVILLPGNTHKQEGLAALLGDERRVHAPWDGEAILADVADILAHHEDHCRRIVAAVGRIREHIAAFAQLLNGCRDRLSGIAHPDAGEPVILPEPALCGPALCPVREEISADIYARANAASRPGRRTRVWPSNVEAENTREAWSPRIAVSALRARLCDAPFLLSLRANLACYDCRLAPVMVAAGDSPL